MSNLELPPPPWIVGHRGAAGEALENTLSAFRRAREAGVDMIELDVQHASDGVAVCFHDWNLERLAGRPEVVVEESSSPRLGDVALGGTGEGMPTLSAALDELAEPLPINVELKRRNADREPLVRAVLAALGGRSQVLISSFDWRLLETVRALAPEMPLAPLSAPREVRARLADPAGDLIAAGERLGAFSLHCSRSMVEAALVKLAESRGFDRLIAYTVNDLDEAERFFEFGVAGLFTDVPTAMIRRFRNPGSESGEAVS